MNQRALTLSIQMEKQKQNSMKIKDLGAKIESHREGYRRLVVRALADAAAYETLNGESTHVESCNMDGVSINAAYRPEKGISFGDNPSRTEKLGDERKGFSELYCFLTTRKSTNWIPRPVVR